MLGSRSSAPQGRQGLHERRRRSRRRSYIIAGILFVIMFGVGVYGLWQKEVRISHIVVYGADQASIATLATTMMQGKYLGFLPRDSIFFFPESLIRRDILATYPDVAAVSIFRSGFTSISIRVDYRTPLAQWCGATPSGARFDLATSSARSNLAPSPSEECYLFDASGFIYATTSATSTPRFFIVYEPLSSGVATTTSSSVIGTTLPQADTFGSVFDFARQISIFGSPTSFIVFRGDEIDTYVESGTRITYVSGNEENAFTALGSARADFNLADGSVDYIDLRFPGKVYLKRKQ